LPELSVVNIAADEDVWGTVVQDLAYSGTMFAVTSALLGVMQSMYAKFLLRRQIVVDTVNVGAIADCFLNGGSGC
jgi:hypothetical protein